MDQRERAPTFVEVMRAMLDGFKARLFTSMPAYVISWDPTEDTVSVQLTIQGSQQQKDGSWQLVTINPLIHCPVQRPRGGGFAFTVPLVEGDEGLVVFAQRCIDGWWQQGGIQPPTEYRLLDISDGFFIPGVSSVPRVLSAISTTTAQLRTDDGLTYLEIADGEINIEGNLNVSGDIDQLGDGVTGSFTTPTGQIVTVTNGIITNIF
jgi:hypothetical protein